MSEQDPLWYKDAIIYQLHVKAFFDANDDGIGDFQGLTAKLDYLQDLGVTALWLLPFYPSPLRDDGYDIADYRDINPGYGCMADFRHFVREAHRRNLKVVTELVVNHTSDQHPWFQRARRAKPGSHYRDYYVWSDTDQKYADTRVIFVDTEKSNWTWDVEAQQYYWHRFYAHQPDLNFDNPAVVRAVTNVMRFWMDLGVDGMRLDAVPYLCEREGTSNENLPESHAILRRLRASMDAEFPGRLLLAEANQWPEDVLPYFGEGDECNMAFHFPLMPRLYMAMAQEDRHPVTDILRQTPDIPENCQWAIFLRNHDELTLEMVTDQERDYLWNFYASDKRARINLGIRRRLAPLMENDRRRIDLLNSLLMSMPGTPVLYYGDEIGMGDNVFLGDRDGVRTPMQWSLDRNGGFSKADPARVYLPTIQDAVYGYQAVNVEAQSRSGSSMLNTMRRLIAVRRGFQAFGRGTLSFLYPSNRKVLAYLRRFENETILCVANLARAAQSVELDLAAFKGLVPIELLGRSAFPPITADRWYHLTLQGHSFFWFALTDPGQMEAGAQVAPEPAPLPELLTLVVPKGWNDILAGYATAEFGRSVLPAFLPTQRWFGAKDRTIAATRVIGGAELPDHSGDGWCLVVVEVSFADAEPQRYQLLLGLEWTPGSELRTLLLNQTLAQTRRFRAEGILVEAMGQEALAIALIDALKHDMTLPFRGGATVSFHRSTVFDAVSLPETPVVRRLGGEQSNSSVLIDEYAVLKAYRRLQDGIHPEIEMTRYLTNVAGFAATPKMLGSIELTVETGEPTALGIVTAFVRNQGDAWTNVLDYLDRTAEEARLATAQAAQTPSEAPADLHGFFMTRMETLGQRTAELHLALCPAAADADPAFAPEPITARDLASWRHDIRTGAETVLDALKARLAGEPGFEPATAELVRRLLDLRPEILRRIDQVGGKLRAVKTRYHGDYHLGQVLVVQNDFMIIDFEGEPRRPIEERRRKHSVLKDVAGMLRSLDYAAWTAIKAPSNLSAAELPAHERFCLEWRDRAMTAFTASYRKTIDRSPVYPSDEEAAGHLLDLLILEKAIYEIGYELANRPTWLSIPVQGVIDLISGTRIGS